MDRRKFITRTFILISTISAGCSNSSKEGKSTDAAKSTTPTTYQPTKDKANRIQLELNNYTENDLQLTITISKNGEAYYNKSKLVKSNKSILIDTGINTAGTYDLKLDIPDRGNASTAFEITDYDIEYGLDRGVTIKSEEIIYTAQE